MSRNELKALLAVDGSEQSQNLVEYFGNVLPYAESKITLLHILKKHPHSFWDLDHGEDDSADSELTRNWEEIQRAAIEKFMDNCIDILAKKGFSKKSVQVLIKDRHWGVAADIREEAYSGYDLVAVGRWGHTDVADLVFGNVTHRLMAKVTDRALCIVAGNPVNQKMLLAIDSTDSSKKAIEFAAGLAGRNGLEVEIFHAIRRLKLPPYIEDTPGVLDGEKRFWESEKKLITPVIEQAAQRLIDSGLDKNKVTSRIVTGVESRAEAIVNEARSKGFDGIILGRRRQSKMEEFFVGRVGDKVFQLARKRAVFIVG